jgi:hypothetical protein
VVSNNNLIRAINALTWIRVVLYNCINCHIFVGVHMWIVCPSRSCSVTIFRVCREPNLEGRTPSSSSAMVSFVAIESCKFSTHNMHPKTNNLWRLFQFVIYPQLLFSSAIMYPPWNIQSLELSAPERTYSALHITTILSQMYDLYPQYATYLKRSLAMVSSVAIESIKSSTHKNADKTMLGKI